MVKIWAEYAYVITEDARLLRISVNYNLEKQWHVTFRLNNEKELSIEQLRIMLRTLGDSILLNDK